MGVPIISNKARKAKANAGRTGFLGAGSSYVAGDSSADSMSSFHPAQKSADAEVLPARDKVTARARDLARNNGWAAGGINKEVDSIIGANFRPILKPDWKALGLSEEWASEFKERAEADWRAYADDPRKFADVTRSQTVSAMFGLGYRTFCIEGEALGVVSWMPNRLTHTALRVVDPDLMSNPDGQPDSPRLRSGVVLNKYGAATHYWFRQAHPNNGLSYSEGEEFQWKRIPREKRFGRPVVLHHFDKTRDGQTRGISRLAPIIEKLKMEDHYSKVELQAAVLNAVLAAFIKSPMGPNVLDELIEAGGDEGDNTLFDSFARMNTSRSDHYGDSGIKVGGARVTTLYPNDEIGMLNTARPAAQFADFEGAVLRNIASGLGISYEQLASDWSKTNYSSARAAMIEIWRSWTARRISFAQGFCQPFFMAWLEEKVMNGHYQLPRNAPDFRENWLFYSRAKWVGPGRGFVDPVKEAQASAMRVALGLSTLEDEAAELTGSDFKENIAQIKREMSDMPKDCLHPMQESFAKLIGHNGGPSIQDED
ncbi:phage portal protein [Thalassovita sp.]|uniref:phage portal protein n=1 Tax=Thalassovita sp. TaxID=1979401 RepID=UPI002AB0833F|nr:phage portal protein [Thalassovita sp.]